jgi:hypothetical protein
MGSPKPLAERIKGHPFIALALLLFGLCVGADQFFGAFDSLRARFVGRDPVPRAEAEVSLVSFREYCVNAMMPWLSGLSEPQRLEYVRALKGKRVTWSGHVALVESYVGAEGIRMSLSGLKVAQFDFDSRPLLMPERGDWVEVSGVIDATDEAVVSLTESRIYGLQRHGAGRVADSSMQSN